MDDDVVHRAPLFAALDADAAGSLSASMTQTELGRGDGKEPLLLVVRPQRPLDFTIGEGTTESPNLTIHIRGPLPPAGMREADHLLGRFSSRLSVAGVWEEDGELWTPGGQLIAQSRQLALARDLPA